MAYKWLVQSFLGLPRAFQMILKYFQEFEIGHLGANGD